MESMTDTMRIALVSEVFFTADGERRLMARLTEARTLGADLVLLPELPLNPWSPATTTPGEEDAEPPDGQRSRILSNAARAAGVALVGGAIVRDPDSGRRHNTALVFDRGGALIGSYRKVHLPDEEGFHEPCHYEPGDRAAGVIEGLGLPLGIQICSDINRPEGSHLLGAAGAVALLNPRATEAATFERWKLVFRANAMTSTAYVLSVNRPSPEQGVGLGGPSIAVAPTGDVLVESPDPVVVVTLERSAIEQARSRYPGYLSIRSDVYAAGWEKLASKQPS
jgi:N-carbamoylputrescine amidase